MKKLLIIFAILCSFSAFAQKNYVWKQFNIQITVPDDFRIKKNTAKEFEMKGEGMELSMLIHEENVAIEDLDDAAIAGAKAMKLQELDAAHQVKINEFEGFYVEGFKDGNRIMFACLGNPNSHTNFFIAIIFDDEDKTAEKDALEILNSLDVS
ncbi:hypothetical protein GCM10011514_19210 [Emticicia aquatilis]|uniref:Uncharacterized protein n=1 Tax=Emticicia aquatilis TaxID=1537369 RepID=A0A917DN87_9BACT|nr:hypothetical protein [Emticicia aquatilis]GGD55172.1 hypothetical protein GCM10011514_19210 [Emticicia aquatilis]